MNADGADLAIIIPLWQRTRHIERVYESARAATPAARIMFVMSAGDTAAVPRPMPGDFLIVPGTGGERGDYARKINAGYRNTTEPFIFTGADDLHFHEGWYDAARPLMAYAVEHKPDGGIAANGAGVVGTNDLCNGRTLNGTHSTHSLVARWYADMGGSYDQDHAIYHEGYWHEWCDDELVQTAMSRRAYAHAFDAIVEHLHPNIKKADDDPTYRRGRERTRDSRRLFMRRRRMWASKLLAVQLGTDIPRELNR